jgi:subtilisin family serine protease
MGAGTSPILRRVGLLLASLLAAALLPSVAAAVEVERLTEREFVPGEVIVAFEPGTDSAERAEILESGDVESDRALHVGGARLVELGPGSGVRRTASSLEEVDGVRYAEPNWLMRSLVTPNDPDFGELWGLNNTGQTVGGQAGTPDSDIDAPEAWELATGSPAVTVGVVDTGVSLQHPDLAENAWVNPGESGGGRETNGIDDDANGFVDDAGGWDFVEDDNAPRDLNGHGTHVAGTVGAQGNNVTGVAGVNWDVGLMPVRVLDATGIGPVSDVAAGMRYAARNGAQVVNLSLGGPPSPLLTDAVNQSPNTLFVAAAGNEGVSNDLTPTEPCNIPASNVICVAASDPNDDLAPFSNFGASSVDLAAPGTNIRSTYSRGDELADNFETDIAGRWTVLGPWERTTLFARTPTHSLADSPVGQYAGNQDATTNFARSPSVNLTGNTDCTLDYHLRLDMDLDAPDDFLRIETSSDGGATFNVILVFWAGGGATAGFPALSESLAPVEGLPAVPIRFAIDSDAVIQDDGAYIDDLAIRCYAPIFELLDGTSMATPHVAGAAALAKGFEPQATVADLRNAILGGVDRVPALTGLVSTGGRLNARRTLELVNRPPDTTITRGPRQGSTVKKPSPTIEFGSEPGATFQCKIDRRAFAACASPFKRKLPDGRHRFSVRAVDKVGAVDPSPAQRSFTVATGRCLGKPAVQSNARTITGTGGRDVIAAGKRTRKISTGGGNDVVCGGPKPESISGGSGRDVLAGGGGGDRVNGGSGGDRLLGGSGKDVLVGGGGNDRCNGGPGSDHERSC